MWRFFLRKIRRESSGEERGLIGGNLGINMSKSDGRVHPSLPLRCKAMGRESPTGEVKGSP